MSNACRDDAPRSRSPDIFRVFFDSVIEESAAVLDRDGRVIGWNSAMVRLTNCPPEEAMGRHVSWFWAGWDDLPRPTEWRWRVRASWEFEEGRPFLAMATITMIPEQDGSPAGFALTARLPDPEEETIGVAPGGTSIEIPEDESDRVVPPVQIPTDRMPLACVILDAELRIVSWNPAAEKTFGFSEAEVIGKSPYEMAIPAHAVGKVEEIDQRLRQGDMAAHSLNANLTKDGRTILCRWTNTPLHAPSGRFLGVLAIGEDVTEATLSSDAFRSSEKLFRAVFEASLDALVLADDEGHCLEANPVAGQILGLNASDLIGRYLGEWLGPEVDFPSEWSEFLKSGHSQSSLRVLRPDGEARHVEYNSVANVLPGRHLSVIRDVTEWRREERKRQESERLARSVLDSLPVQIAVLEEDGTVLQVNKAWRDFAGLNGGSCRIPEGMNYLEFCDSLAGQHVATAVAMAKGIREVMDGERPDFAMEYYCSFQKREHWFKGEVQPFQGEGPRRVVVSHLDVTERKTIEVALKRNTDRLTILRSIDCAILSARSSEEIAETILDHLAELIPNGAGSVETLNRETGEVRVLGHRRGEGFSTTADGPGVDPPGEALNYSVQMPLWQDGKNIGSLNISSQSPPEDYQLELAREVADQLAIAMRQSLLYEEIASGKEHLEMISRRLIRAEEDERQRIARELHDEVGQALTAVKSHIQAALNELGDASLARHKMDEGIGIVERILRQIRSISLDLRPSLLDDFGLVAALRSLVNTQARLGGFATHFRVIADDPEFRLGPELETACFRVAQESLTNVVRYAGAKYVEVELRRDLRSIELSVVDDGVGFDPEDALEQARSGESIGLLGMKERATLLGGHVEVESAPGRGARIIARFPMT